MYYAVYTDIASFSRVTAIISIRKLVRHNAFYMELILTVRDVSNTYCNVIQYLVGNIRDKSLYSAMSE